jgi:hypothetical protein
LRRVPEDPIQQGRWGICLNGAGRMREACRKQDPRVWKLPLYIEKLPLYVGEVATSSFP